MFKFKFKKPFYKNFNELNFKQDDNIIYYDNSHKNYIYNEIIKEDGYNIKYTFYGFFKDDFFVIIFDSYNILLNINIEHKMIILVKIKWVLNQIWELDISENYRNKEVLILNVRKQMLNESFIKIDDLIKIYDYNTILVNITYLINEQNHNFSIFHLLKCLTVANEES